MRKVIDVHAHVGSSAALYVAGSGDAVITRMRNCGITHSVISPIPGYEDAEGVESSKKASWLVKKLQEEKKEMFPLALGVAEPRHGVAALSAVEYAMGELELEGLMFHHDFAGVEMHAPVVKDIIAEACRYRKHPVIQVHTAQHSMLEPPFSLWILAEKFPEVTFLCGHPMMSQIQLDNMLAVASRCPNIIFDTCCTWTHDRQIERVIEKMGGSENIMFGSDNPYYNEHVCIDKEVIEHADISEEDRENIFYRNFERIFGKTEVM
ncbi:MAG: amidohydrolase family protein [Eubacteriales bacterium]|nr:amidohydrolase family protein [Eubacteriales bacterium]